MWKKYLKKPPVLKKECIRCHKGTCTCDEAIEAVGEQLETHGYIEHAYIKGMLERDHSLSTYIGNDIAVPHGEYEVKDCVKHTGMAVDVYPEGVDWGNGKVRLVIGVAASTNDHIILLQKISEKFADQAVVDKAVEQGADYIYRLLAGK